MEMFADDFTRLNGIAEILTTDESKCSKAMVAPFSSLLQ